MPGWTAHPERPDYPVPNERSQVSDETALLERAQAQIEGEIAPLQAEHDRLDEALFATQAEYDVLWAEVPPDSDDPRLNALSDQLMEIFGTQDNLRRRIEVLRSPSEALRRIVDGSGKAAVNPDGTPKAKRQAEPKASARDRGVPEDYLGETGNFRPGMDARYKSDLILSALGLPAPDALMEFDPEDAVARIEERGWTHFLDRKREKMG